MNMQFIYLGGKIEILHSVAAYKPRSFRILAFTVRLLSLAKVPEKEILLASSTINTFFQSFKTLYGDDLQRYNFHSTRHLCDQVRRTGPLWN